MKYRKVISHATGAKHTALVCVRREWQHKCSVCKLLAQTHTNGQASSQSMLGGFPAHWIGPFCPLLLLGRLSQTDRRVSRQKGERKGRKEHWTLVLLLLRARKQWQSMSREETLAGSPNVATRKKPGYLQSYTVLFQNFDTFKEWQKSQTNKLSHNLVIFELINELPNPYPLS